MMQDFSLVEGLPTSAKLSSNRLIPRARLWTAFSLITLIALTILFDAGDFTFIQKSLGRARKGSIKREISNDTEIQASSSEDSSPTLALGKEQKLIASNPATATSSDKTTIVSKSANAGSFSNGEIVTGASVSKTSSLIAPTIGVGEEPSNSTVKATSQPDSNKNLSSISFQSAPLVQSPSLASTYNATQAVELRSSPIVSKGKPLSTSPLPLANISSAAVPSFPSCRRSCPHYNNKIFLSNPPSGGAGINDRMYVISRTLQLAGYLCARLYISRPKFWLAAGHNQGEEIDVRMTWDEFQVYRFVDDASNSSALVDWVNPENVNMLPLVRKIKRSRKYHRWQYVRTEREPDIVMHFEQIETFSFLHARDELQQSDQPNGFLWEIQPDFYDWMTHVVKLMEQRHRFPSLVKPFHPTTTTNNSHLSLYWRSAMQPFGEQRPTQPCSYVISTVPYDIVRIVDTIFDKIRNSHSHHDIHSQNISNKAVAAPRPWIGYFHVRRGDAINMCNTTLERMERFLTCSVGEPLSALTKASQNSTGPRRQVILLFSSDERSTEYRNELARLVEQQEHYPGVNHSFKVSFADLDELGRREISTDIQRGQIPAWRFNNLYLFRLISTVEWGRPEISFRLEQRRMTCPACTNMTHHLIWSHALSD